MAKRPQNKCKNCYYTWYPRGHSVSVACPKCGCRDVGFSIFEWIKTIVSIFVFIFIVSIFSKSC